MEPTASPNPNPTPQPAPQENNPQPAKPVQPSPVKNSLLMIMSALIIILVVVAGFFAWQTQKLTQQIAGMQTAPTPTPTATPTATPTQEASPSASPASVTGWKTYTNTQYGFTLNYPNTYQVLTDSKNLYGWPKAVALLYKGGQSYDLAIEVWDSEAEYKQKYTAGEDVTAFQKNGKAITLLNTNKDSEVARIISTFKFTETSTGN